MIDLKDISSLLRLTRVSTYEALQERVRAGFPSRSLDAVRDRLNIGLDPILRIIGMSPATAARRKSTKSALGMVESDRLLRIASTFAVAHRVFEDWDKAADWMKTPNRALHGAEPLQLLDTEVGAMSVMRVLGRIEHGLYS